MFGHLRLGWAVVGVAAGLLVGFLTTFAVGFTFGFIVGDNGWTEGKVAAFLPVLALGASALWPHLGRATRASLLGAAIGWLVGGSACLLLFTNVD